VEPFGGGLAILWARDTHDDSKWLPPHKGVSEVVNDLDGRLTNFYRVLQGFNTFERFRRIVEAIPFSRVEWEKAHGHADNRTDPVADAVAFFVECRMSLAGRQKGFTPLTRGRLRRGINGNVSEWLGAVDGLGAVHERLRMVVVENLPATKLIRREDGPGTLFYCDPPYLPKTRVAKHAYGRFEMSEAEHRELLEVLQGCAGRVMLSGYPSALYDNALADWNRHTFDLPNNAAGGRRKGRETEVLWCNF
jgi:DNA adenine methylase